MELSTIGILGTLGGTILGGFIGYFTAIRISKRQEFNKAAADFRQAFLPEISFLQYNAVIDSKPGRNNTVNDFLNTARMKHLESIMKFKPYLSARQRKQLDIAFDEYKHPEGHKDTERQFSFDEYHYIAESRGDDVAKKIALSKINT